MTRMSKAELREMLVELGLLKPVPTAHCRECGYMLSEWFTSFNERTRRRVMYCGKCGQLSPWATHEEFRAKAVGG